MRICMLCKDETEDTLYSICVCNESNVCYNCYNLCNENKVVLCLICRR